MPTGFYNGALDVDDAPTSRANLGITNASISPYIVGATYADYATIQAAITAAAGAGASRTNPINIYVKPKSGGYTEDLTMSDGVNIIAFGGQLDQPYPISTSGISGFPAVHLSGKIIVDSDAEFKIQGLYVVNTGANDIVTFSSAQTGFAQFANCNFSYEDGYLLQLTDCNANVNIVGCSAASIGTGSIFNMTNVLSNGILSLNVGNSTLSGVISTVDSGMSLSATLSNSVFSSDISAPNASGISVSALNCSLSASGSSLISMGDITSGTIGLTNCDLYGSITASGSNTSNFVSLVDCRYNSIVITNLTYTKVNCYRKALFAIENKLSLSAYSQSDLLMSQSTTQTSDTTTTTIITISVPTGASCLIQGTVNGASADHTDATGAQFSLIANNDVGTLTINPLPTINIMATTTGTVSVTTSGTDLLVQVTSPLNAAYNWSAWYSYNLLVTNN